MATYYRGVKIQNKVVEKRSPQLSGLYRGVSWTSKDLEQSPKASGERVYRGVKWTV